MDIQAAFSRNTTFCTFVNIAAYLSLVLQPRIEVEERRVLVRIFIKEEHNAAFEERITLQVNLPNTTLSSY